MIDPYIDCKIGSFLYTCNYNASNHLDLLLPKFIIVIIDSVK